MLILLNPAVKVGRDFPNGKLEKKTTAVRIREGILYIMVIHTSNRLPRLIQTAVIVGLPKFEHQQRRTLILSR